ncbi:MAG: sigma-70 family RNA polymerase sigma factor [Verrucomicrobiales bacterium]|nr:sigma-70 family RNA polymerase sigma factor [Verrucomicrobiales bacterium]
MDSRDSASFHTTRWTQVVRARGQQDVALAQLCEAYWYPLYVFVRRCGHGASDAQDLTQSFFLRLLEKHWLNGVDPERGKFRTFLMTAMKRFLTNEWKAAHRLKRGGVEAVIPLDAVEAETRYAAEPGSLVDGTAVFDRRWALTLLECSLERLEEEQADARLFATLKPALTAGHGAFDCEAAARQLGMKEGTVRVAVHRLRKRFREIFREEIAHTVSDPGDVEAEIHYLIEVLARG